MDFSLISFLSSFKKNVDFSISMFFNNFSQTYGKIQKKSNFAVCKNQRFWHFFRNVNLEILTSFRPIGVLRRECADSRTPPLVFSLVSALLKSKCRLKGGSTQKWKGPTGAGPTRGASKSLKPKKIFQNPAKKCKKTSLLDLLFLELQCSEHD